MQMNGSFAECLGVHVIASRVTFRDTVTWQVLFLAERLAPTQQFLSTDTSILYTMHILPATISLVGTYMRAQVRIHTHNRLPGNTCS